MTCIEKNEYFSTFGVGMSETRSLNGERFAVFGANLMHLLKKLMAYYLDVLRKI